MRGNHDRDLLGFLLVVLHAQHLDRVAQAVLGPERLFEQLGIVADHRVGRLQDARGGAVILLQLDDPQIGEIDLQLLQVFDSRAAPRIDRLVVVAHCGKHRLLADPGDQQLDQFVLAGVGVLVFVHQQVAQAALPFFTHRVVAAEQLDRQADQVVEIDRLIGRQRRHVVAIDARGLRLVFGDRAFQCAVGIDHAVFPQRHRALYAPHQLLVGGNRQILHQRKAIVAIHDRKAILQAEFARLLPQDFHAQRMECADRQVFRLLRVLQQLGDALLHFGRRLVGEGQRGDVLRFVPALLDQMGDLLRDDARLPRTGAGQHQAGAVHVVNRLALGRVQTGKWS